MCPPNEAEESIAGSPSEAEESEAEEKHHHSARSIVHKKTGTGFNPSRQYHFNKIE
jgi:hypothetical protein